MMIRDTLDVLNFLFLVLASLSWLYLVVIRTIIGIQPALNLLGFGGGACTLLE